MDFDGPYKTLFSNPDMIEDLIKNFVDEDWVETLDFTTLELMNSSFIGDQMQRREGDLIFKLNNKAGQPNYVLVLLELQSSSDHWMSVRFLTYVGLLYQQLIKEKQVTKKGKLPPVFPLVLYNGSKKWQGALKLKTLIDLPRQSKLWRYQPSIDYYIIDESEHLNTNTESLSSILFKFENSANQRELEKLLGHFLEQLAKINDPAQLHKDLLTYIKYVCAPITQLELDFGHIESISEARAMLIEKIPQWEEKLVQKGIGKGIEQGIEQGSIIIITKIITKRFGDPTPEIYQKLENATAEEIDEWAMRILEAQTIDDVFKH